MPEHTSGPRPTRGHKKRARTRQQLLTAAVEVIAERGEAFSVNDVTERAGVSNGTFYNYFTDRDALLAAIVPGVLGDFAAELATAVADADPAVRFAAITALALHRARTDPDHTRVVLRLGAAQHELLHGEPLRHLRADLADGWAAGRFAAEPTDAVLDVIVGGILTASRRIVDSGVDGRYDIEVIETLLRSLGVDDPEAGTIARQAVDRTGRPTGDPTGG